MRKKLIELLRKIFRQKEKSIPQIEFIQKESNKAKKKIIRHALVLDNGGMKMLSCKDILVYLQNVCTKKQLKFDIVAGSGAGALIATAIANDVKIEKLSNYILSNTGEIFAEEKHNFLKKQIYKYSSENIHKIIKGFFMEDGLLRDSKIPLLISAINAQEKKREFFTSFNEFNDIKISEAVIASCSATGFFPPLEIKGKSNYMSDNIISYGPLFDTFKTLREKYDDADEFRILSIASCKNAFDATDNKRLIKDENLRTEINAVTMFDNAKLLRIENNENEIQNYEIDSFDKHCILNLLRCSENNARLKQNLIDDFIQ